MDNFQIVVFSTSCRFPQKFQNRKKRDPMILFGEKSLLVLFLQRKMSFVEFLSLSMRQAFLEGTKVYSNFLAINQNGVPNFEQKLPIRCSKIK